MPWTPRGDAQGPTVRQPFVKVAWNSTELLSEDPRKNTPSQIPDGTYPILNGWDFLQPPPGSICHPTPLGHLHQTWQPAGARSPGGPRRGPADGALRAWCSDPQPHCGEGASLAILSVCPRSRSHHGCGAGPPCTCGKKKNKQLSPTNRKHPGPGGGPGQRGRVPGKDQSGPNETHLVCRGALARGVQPDVRLINTCPRFRRPHGTEERGRKWPAGIKLLEGDEDPAARDPPEPCPRSVLLLPTGLERFSLTLSG